MISKIQYKNKQSIQNDENIAEENKVTDTNMNEIKQVVNNNAEELEEVQTNISNIEKKNTEQDENITNNTKSIEELKTENEALKAENKLIKEQIPSATASGNSIHVEDSGTLDFDWKINGNQHQATREGYNKIDLSSISTEVTGIKALYDNETGYITFNGTPTANYPRFFSLDITDMLNDGEKWTIWQEKAPPGTDKEILLQVIERKSATENTHYYSSASSGNKTSFTVDKTQYSYYLNLLGGTIANIGTLTNYKNRYMLYKGTEDKPYEQYGASPSPDYPSEIETVGSNVNELNIADVEEKEVNGVKYSVKNGVLRLDGTATEGIDITLIKNVILKKGIYTHSTNYIQVGIFASFDNENGLNGSNNITKNTFELTEDTTYSRYFVWINEGTVLNNVEQKLKLEKGSAATSWSPYNQGSVEIDVVNSNLLDFNVAQDSRVTVNEDGTLTINGAGGFSLNIDKLQLKAGITYYQKVELISGSISGSNIDNTFLSFVGAGKWISSKIFTESSFNEDTEKTVIWINASAIFNNAVIRIWANTDKSDFVKHQSQTAIMPIQQEMLTGDYIEDVEHHEWKKVIITGDENWIKSTNLNNISYYLISNAVLNGIDKKTLSPSADAQDKVVATVISNYFKIISPHELFSLGEIGCCVNLVGSEMQLRLGFSLNSNLTDLTKFKSWVKSKYEEGIPIEIWYKLATPVDLELTSEQKAVRDTKLYTYKNITNIAVSDELASIDVKYGRDLDAIINNLQAMSINNASEEV